MRILVALDSFKDGCSSIEACEAVARGCQLANPDADIVICPISDGGEGTVDILHHHLGGELVSVEVSNPLFRTMEAHYLMSDDETAFIEMAAASGLELLTSAERNPMNTSTFGTGELILDALDKGCSRIILSVGGSATNDLGIGMANALGAKFVDQSGNILSPIGHSVGEVSKINLSNLDDRVAKVGFTVITDVSNPLFGPSGAAFIYARQKGGNDQSINELDLGLRHMDKVIQADLGKKIADIPRSGAAGGLAGGCVAFLDAEIRSGFETIRGSIDLATQVQSADLIITGEGRIDNQTNQGKVVSGIAKLAEMYDKKVVALCGVSEIDEEEARSMGVSEVLSISALVPSDNLEMALSRTTKDLAYVAEHYLKKHL